MQICGIYVITDSVIFLSFYNGNFDWYVNIVYFQRYIGALEISTHSTSRLFRDTTLVERSSIDVPLWITYPVTHMPNPRSTFTLSSNHVSMWVHFFFFFFCRDVVLRCLLVASQSRAHCSCRHFLSVSTSQPPRTMSSLKDFLGSMYTFLTIGTLTIH